MGTMKSKLAEIWQSTPTNNPIRRDLVKMDKILPNIRMVVILQ